jgi:hypothetical protein
MELRIEQCRRLRILRIDEGMRGMSGVSFTILDFVDGCTVSY